MKMSRTNYYCLFYKSMSKRLGMRKFIEMRTRVCLILACVSVFMQANADDGKVTSTETWVQEHSEVEKNYEIFIFSKQGNTIIGGQGESVSADTTLKTKIENCNSNNESSCQLSRSDGKSGLLKIISRDATTMRATVTYLAPGQTQTWMPIILIFKKK
jgi:hypothetical protein